MPTTGGIYLLIVKKSNYKDWLLANFNWIKKAASYQRLIKQLSVMTVCKDWENHF